MPRQPGGEVAGLGDVVAVAVDRLARRYRRRQGARPAQRGGEQVAPHQRADNPAKRPGAPVVADVDHRPAQLDRDVEGDQGPDVELHRRGIGELVEGGLLDQAGHDARAEVERVAGEQEQKRPRRVADQPPVEERRADSCGCAQDKFCGFQEMEFVLMPGPPQARFAAGGRSGSQGRRPASRAGPYSITRPPSRIRISSARCTVRRRWAMMMRAAAVSPAPVAAAG